MNHRMLQLMRNTLVSDSCIIPYRDIFITVYLLLLKAKCSVLSVTEHVAADHSEGDKKTALEPKLDKKPHI